MFYKAEYIVTGPLKQLHTCNFNECTRCDSTAIAICKSSTQMTISIVSSFDNIYYKSSLVISILNSKKLLRLVTVS